MNPQPAAMVLLLALSCVACSGADAPVARAESPAHPRSDARDQARADDASAVMAKPPAAPAQEADAVSSNSQARTSAR